MRNGRILVLAVVALASVPQAWAQEVPALWPVPSGTIDSVQVQSVHNAQVRLPALQGDSIADRAKGAAKDQLPAVQLPDSAASARHFTTRGQIELGGIQGPLPYSAKGASAWNGYAKGEVGAELFGVPVKVMLDLGTDLPVRGQRNSVRFAFDAPRLLDREKWGDASALHGLRSQLDSLEDLRAAQFRVVKGAEGRLAAYGPPRAVPPTMPISLADTVGMTAPANPLDTFPVPSAEALSISGPRPDAAKVDSLRNMASREKQRLAQLDEWIAEQRMRVQRLASVMNAAKAEPGIMKKFTQGIKRLDLGSCSPGSSEFLINGVTFQGVSFAYERKGIYLSFDKGRSFDDAWMDVDPVRDRLRSLQQSLFFTDARDLNPRRLTAIKVGVGSPGATHFHVGYLNGSREDIPLGMAVPPGPAYTLRNQVVELDAGYAVQKDHLLRIAFARSVTSGYRGEEAGASSPQVGDLFEMKGGMDQAVKLGWSSTFERTGTRAEAEVRSISPYFQSFGMGFVRNGSRAVEVRLDQRLGKAFRLRGRYSMEQRTIPGEGAERAVAIQRTQAMVTYRPTRSLTLRAGAMPLRVRTAAADGGRAESNNGMYTMGADLRRRWGKTVALLSMDLGLYEWKAPEGTVSTIENHSVALSVLQGDRWSAQASWTGMGELADSSMAPAGNFSLHVRHQAGKGTVVDGGVQLPVDGRTGWTVEIRKPLGKRISVGVRGESFSRSDLFFTEDVWSDHKNDYNWTLLTRFTW